jgi:hypothetical protein
VDTYLDSHNITADGSATDFFLIGFSSVKSPYWRKSKKKKKKKMENTKSVLYINFFHRKKKTHNKEKTNFKYF